MKIRKEAHETLDNIALLLEPHYPGSKVTKPLLAGKILTVPFDNFKFILRDKKNYLFVDFMLPAVRQGVSAFMFGAIGLLIHKAIFKARRKERFQAFLDNVDMLINRGGIESIGEQLV